MNIISLIILFAFLSIINNLLEGEKKKRNIKPVQKRSQQPPFVSSRRTVDKTSVAQALENKSGGNLSETRSTAGSLDYIEFDEPDEEILMEALNDKVSEPEDIESDSSELRTPVFDLSDLHKSIVLAEVLGPPRALKKRMR